MPRRTLDRAPLKKARGPSFCRGQRWGEGAATQQMQGLAGLQGRGDGLAARIFWAQSMVPL